MLIQVHEHIDEEVDHAVEVLAVDDAVMCVRVPDRHDEVDGGRAAVRGLHLRRIVAIALHQIELQWDVVGRAW